MHNSCMIQVAVNIVKLGGLPVARRHGGSLTARNTATACVPRRYTGSSNIIQSAGRSLQEAAKSPCLTD